MLNNTPKPFYLLYDGTEFSSVTCSSPCLTSIFVAGDFSCARTTHALINQVPVTDMKTHSLLFPVLCTYAEMGGLLMLLFFFLPAIFSCSVNGLHNQLDLLHCFLPSPTVSLSACPQAPPACIFPKDMGLNYSKYNPRQEKGGQYNIL